MSAEQPDNRIMNACPTCGGVMDVTACAPYSKVVCPSCSTPVRVRTDFDHFTLKKQIGEGGMSRVFLALDRTLNREAALKILNPDLSKDGARIEQFEREARITASMSHPNVVKVYSVGNDQGHFFIAMELVPFGSLDEMINKEGRVPEDRVLEMAEQLALGLKAAFDAGLIHRDMKPGNILFSQDGTAKVVDFGLALVIDQEDEDKEIWATPYYVPPEKLHKKPEDFRSDIYSLGATLFHALAGQPPYSADTASLEELKLIKDKPVSLVTFAPHVSSETAALIDRMMARKPNDRYRDYKELLEHIRFARQASHESSDPTVAAQRTQQAARRLVTRNVAVAAVAVAVLTLVGVIAGQLLKGGGEVDDDDGEPVKKPVFASKTDTSTKFLSAREALFAGDFQKASNVFQELASSGGTKQPTLNWARFNTGLCALFRGDARAATKAYQEIVDAGKFSTEGPNAELATFFYEVSETMASPLPVPLEERSQYSSENSEALALLAFGLKDWEAGYYVEATEFFELFRKSNPSAGEAWVNDYKGLLDNYAHDMKLVADFPAVRREPALDQAELAMEKAKGLVKTLRSGASVKRRLGARVKRMERLLKRLEREGEVSEQAKMTALRTGEQKRLRELRESVVDFAEGYAFPEAIQTIRGEMFFHPDSKQASADLLYLYQSAEDFLETLVADVEKHGYTGTVERANATDLIGTVTAAERGELSVQIGSSARSTVPVATIPPVGLIRMARTYLEKYPEMADYNRRRELLVVFAHVVGADAEADRYGDELRGEWREFREKWARLVEEFDGDL